MNFCGGNISNQIILSTQVITSFGMKIMMFNPVTMKVSSEIKFDHLIRAFGIFDHGLNLAVLLNNGDIKMFHLLLL
jgi:hypothetical protein